MKQTSAFIQQHPKWKSLEDYIRRVERSLKTSPGSVVENCKSLMESIFKTIIVEVEGKSENDFKRCSIGKLNKWIREILGLEERGYAQIIGTFSNAIANFRNSLGETSHGKDIHTLEKNRNALSEDEINFLINVADAIAFFLLNKYEKSTLPRPSNAKTSEENKILKKRCKLDWKHSDATYLALAPLIGSWDGKNEYDLKMISQFLGIDYDAWLNKAREILHLPNSPLALKKNGIWKVINRTDLWNSLGSRIFDQNLDNFKSLAINVLKERAPAFDLPINERFMANVKGKILNYSNALRKGIAEGLAILGNQPDAGKNCSQGKIKETGILVVREVLTDADGVTWGSLNDLLPILAEIDPDEFLRGVEEALCLERCPFDELFAQEDDSVFGANYLTGLFWALEGLAWDAQYLVKVCYVLGELASHDPGDQWTNRPSNSLVTILLPWLPQTLASVEKRKVAVETLLKECPDIAWKLIIQLLPNQHQSSSGSHKPIWRKIIPDDWSGKVTNEEYQQQILSYADLAVDAAGCDITRLSVLIDNFSNLPMEAFDHLIKVLESQNISKLPEKKRLLLWEHLIKFTRKHRRFSDEKWALPDDFVTRIENIAEQLAPTDPFNLYQHLFASHDSDLYDQNGDWKEQRKRLDARREKAIKEIFHQHGVEGVIRFSKYVISSRKVGYALGIIPDTEIEKALLPHFLNETDSKRQDLVSLFIWRRHHINDWKWCDGIDKAMWSPAQIGSFFACLPFINETWARASKWLKENEREYWSRASVNTSHVGEEIAIEKFIEYGRSHSAIDYLSSTIHAKKTIDPKQCIQALRTATFSNGHPYDMRQYHIVELIKFLQEDTSVTQKDLIEIEWAYLPLLDRHSEAAPKFIENELASDPEFFCKAIQILYRSKNEKQPKKEPTEETKARAERILHLLREWKTPPGTQENKTFDAKHFKEWLRRVKEICVESGHLEAALESIGQVLIHTPPDEDGLWIDKIVATALNDRDSQEMRNGFSDGVYRSRGDHTVDPKGKPEKELAKQFMKKAEDVENAGFHRFADTLKDLSKEYERKAEIIISKYSDD